MKLPSIPQSFFLLLLAAIAAYSDTSMVSPRVATDSIIPVEGIVVTATRSNRRISETPSSISVITKKEIKASPAKTIEDLLATQTNIQPRRSAAIGEGIPGDIAIRGIPGALAASRTLVLVDGIPTNASGTPFLIINEVPVEAIERIEIVRGPNSSLYGANALGGVINIVTQEGQEKPRGDFIAETSYPFTAAALYGNDAGSATTVLDSSLKKAYWNVNGTVSGKTGKTGFLVSTGYRTIGDYLLRDSAMGRKGNETKNMRNINYDYEEFRLLGKARFYATERNSLSLNVRYFKSTLGFGQTKKITPDSLDVETKGEKFLVGPQLKMALSDNITLRAGAFYRTVTGEFQNEGTDSAGTGVQSYWKSYTQDGQFESQATFTLSPSNNLNCGFEILSNNVDFGATINPITGALLPNADSVRQGIINGAVYIQEELKFFDRRLNLVPVLRMDYHSTFGTALSPKISLNYKLFEQLRFRTSLGRSFRAPSLAELYMPDLHVNPNFVIRCNPDLKPEYLIGADGGFEAELWNSLTIKTDVFYNKMTDLISPMLFLNGATPNVSHRNVVSAWSKGVESEVTWRYRSWFWMSVSSAFQNSFDDLYLVKLDYVPDYTLGFRSGFSWRIKDISSMATVGVKRIGDRSYLDFPAAEAHSRPDGYRIAPVPVDLDPYQTVDLSLRCSRSRYSLTFTGQNIFNASGEETGGVIIPGRFASMKLGISF